MEEFAIDQNELDDLKTRLETLQLSPAQRKVLNGMIRLAGDLADGAHPDEESEEPRAYTEDFAGAFTPSQASLVVEYATAAGGGVYHATGTAAHPPHSAVTAMITR